MLPDPASPDDELAALQARRRRTRVRQAVLVALVVAAAAAVWWARRPRPEPAERTLFARTIPRWSIERLNDRDGEYDLARIREGAAQWPAVQARLVELAAAWGPDRARIKAAAAKVNSAVREAGLPFWIDTPHVAGKQWLLTYDALARASWALQQGGGAVEVLQVRRLDRVNLEMAFLGHADGDQPVVLVDRVERELVDLMGSAWDDGSAAGRVEKAARGAWRSAMERVAGAEDLREAARLLDERAMRVERLAEGAARGVEIDVPQRLVLGDEFLDSLEPYADLKRPGGPVIQRANLRALREADRALRSGPARRALERVLEEMVLDTEAHEARHRLETLPEGPPPGLLAEVVGEDEPQFARKAARELVAYLGQLHASEVPCATLAQFAFRAAGDHARATPHHFAAWVLLQLLSSAPGDELTEQRLVEDLPRLCAETVPALRERTAKAHYTFFGTELVAAGRKPLPVAP